MADKNVARIKALEAEVERLKAELSATEALKGEQDESRQAMLFMLEDMNESAAMVAQIKDEWVQTFDAVTDPIFSHDVDFHIVRANRAYAECASMSVEDVIGKLYWEVFPKGDGPLQSCLSAFEKAEEEEEEEEEIRLESGQIFLNRTYAMRKEGEGLYSIHLMKDITEHKRIEESIREIEERFRSVSETAQDAIILLDNDGTITLWNPAAERMLGYAHDEAMGRTLDQLAIPERHRKAHIQGYAAFRDTGQGAVVGKTVELTALRKSGDEFPIELSISKTKTGGKWSAVGIMRDISERKKSEEALKQSHGRLQRSLEGCVQAIASAVEARDPYTAGHQRRVANLATAIAQEMGLEVMQIEGIHMGATIHDIGKIHLPAEILSKPEKLTEIEYSLVQSHSQVGYDILKNIEFPWPVADIAHQHHERMDGSGYPQGLKGDEICLEAKVVAVADVVEAMASHRPYRAGLGIDAALAEIESGRGKYFDPQVVDACLKIFADGFTWSATNLGKAETDKI